MNAGPYQPPAEILTTDGQDFWSSVFAGAIDRNEPEFELCVDKPSNRYLIKWDTQTADQEASSDDVAALHKCLFNNPTYRSPALRVGYDGCSHEIIASEITDDIGEVIGLAFPLDEYVQWVKCLRERQQMEEATPQVLPRPNEKKGPRL